MKRHYEDAPEYDAQAYRVAGYSGVAFCVLGWETRPGNDTDWTGTEDRTGRLIVVMVGDDTHHAVDPDDVTPLNRTDYCSACGQIGCGCDAYDRNAEV